MKTSKTTVKFIALSTLLTPFVSHAEMSCSNSMMTFLKADYKELKLDAKSKAKLFFSKELREVADLLKKEIDDLVVIEAVDDSSLHKFFVVSSGEDYFYLSSNPRLISENSTSKWGIIQSSYGKASRGFLPKVVQLGSDKLAYHTGTDWRIVDRFLNGEEAVGHWLRNSELSTNDHFVWKDELEELSKGVHFIEDNRSALLNTSDLANAQFFYAADGTFAVAHIGETLYFLTKMPELVPFSQGKRVGVFPTASIGFSDQLKGQYLLENDRVLVVDSKEFSIRNQRDLGSEFVDRFIDTEVFDSMPGEEKRFFKHYRDEVTELVKEDYHFSDSFSEAQIFFVSEFTGKDQHYVLLTPMGVLEFYEESGERFYKTLVDIDTGVFKGNSRSIRVSEEEVLFLYEGLPPFVKPFKFGEEEYLEESISSDYFTSNIEKELKKFFQHVKDFVVEKAISKSEFESALDVKFGTDLNTGEENLYLLHSGVVYTLSKEGVRPLDLNLGIGFNKEVEKKIVFHDGLAIDIKNGISNYYPLLSDTNVEEVTNFFLQKNRNLLSKTVFGDLSQIMVHTLLEAKAISSRDLFASEIEVGFKKNGEYAVIVHGELNFVGEVKEGKFLMRNLAVAGEEFLLESNKKLILKKSVGFTEEIKKSTDVLEEDELFAVLSHKASYLLDFALSNEQRVALWEAFNLGRQVYDGVLYEEALSNELVNKRLTLLFSKGIFSQEELIKMAKSGILN